ncbi:MAG: leucine-rich repeat protein [Bacteroidales bacterium]|nr:leucine-rich repeat protein [Bacteroidales bacterium]
MKMNKRLSVVAVMLAGVVGWTMASETEVAGIYYNFNDGNKTAEVTYKGKCHCAADTYAGVVNIPSKVVFEGVEYNVTSVGDYAFASSRKLTGVVIPTSVKSIGYNAFVGCRQLENVEFAQPSGVSEIGRQAFLACQNLKSIEIPSSVETIGRFAFEMCDKLENVTFQEPSNITMIDEYVFCRTGLHGITVPASVKVIEDVAFCSNPNMLNVMLPATVVEVSERNPFCYNTQVVSMSVEAGNPTYDSRDNCNAFIETKTNTLVAGCKTTKIPASVTAIGRSAFNHVTDMTDAALPATITSIGKYAYLGCTGLKSFYFPSTMEVMADSVFWQIEKLDSIVTMAQKPFKIDESDFQPAIYDNATLYVPAGTAKAYKVAPVWQKFRKIVELDAFVVDGVSYELQADGTAKLVAPTEGVAYTKVVVPKTVKSGENTYEVSAVAEDAFAQMSEGRVIYGQSSEASNIGIYGGKGVIKIEGSDAEATVYNQAGVPMVVTTKRIIPMEQGLYVVKVGGKSAKVLVE